MKKLLAIGLLCATAMTAAFADDATSSSTAPAMSGQQAPAPSADSSAPAPTSTPSGTNQVSQ